MYRNKFNQKLKERKKMCTVAQIEDGVRFAEMAGFAGFDAVLLDCQHTAASQIEVEHFIRACECGGAVPFVRTRELNKELVLRYLDAGAMGILFPDIKTAEDARRAVEAVKFPPMGKRGISCTRSFNYGYGMSYTEYLEMSNRETTVMLMIETPEAVENIEAILDVEGVDELELGTTDLSLRLGHPGNRTHPDVEAAVASVMEAARKRKIPVGSIMRQGMTIEEEMQKGYGVMTFCMADELCKMMDQFIRTVDAER